MLLSPCKNCPDRFVGCHSQCEKYKAFRAELDKQSKERLRHYENENDYYGTINALKVRRRKRQ